MQIGLENLSYLKSVYALCVVDLVRHIQAHPFSPMANVVVQLMAAYEKGRPRRHHVKTLDHAAGTLHPGMHTEALTATFWAMLACAARGSGSGSEHA